MHVQIALRIVGDDRLELPFITDPENQQYVSRFAWEPPADPLEGDNLFVCWNGRFDRSQLTSNRQPNEFCSSGSNGAQTGEVEGATGKVAPIQAGGTRSSSSGTRRARSTAIHRLRPTGTPPTSWHSRPSIRAASGWCR